MPDEPKTTTSSARSQSLRWNDTPSSAAAVLASDDADKVESTSERQVASVPGKQQELPSWWDPPPTIHVDQRYKDQVPSSTHFVLCDSGCPCGFVLN